MTTGTILVHISDHQWTTQAMHLACAMARNTHSRLVLLHLMAVRSPYLLGSEFAVEPPSRRELEKIAEYDIIADNYGVEAILHPMQYESFGDALVQAVEHTDASAIFAHMPEGLFPVWRRLRLWNLRRRLVGLGCQLYALDEPQQVEEWAPSVSLGALR
jgi:hypothetical protein